MDRANVYDTTTAAILRQLEAGTRPWAAAWDKSGGMSFPLNHAGRHYRGVNVPLLWGAQQEAGFLSPFWLTFKQALDLGGNVRKGEKSRVRVVYWDKFTPAAERGKDDAREVMFCKAYAVFNADQCEGLPAHFTPAPAAPRTWCDDGGAAAFVANTGARITDEGARAYYRPSTDQIVMPARNRWENAADYYATLFHELTHWTGHKARLDRETGKRFGDQAYAAEELIAEMGAAFLGATVQLATQPRVDHADYLASWISILKADNRAIFTAASMAQKACDFLHTLQEPQALAA